ncbi:hypothetical protein, partial [Oscillatoria sp. HE19RPO]|uniref:hypothetical protein n=1 Tax=Oscillatoria sp. HE19RPO TaxID=2954806 RepID=UPI0020C44AF6
CLRRLKRKSTFNNRIWYDNTESGCQRSVKTRRLKPGAIQTKPAYAGYSIKTFHTQIWYKRGNSRIAPLIPNPVGVFQQINHPNPDG